jgi:hypothetical protein
MPRELDRVALTQKLFSGCAGAQRVHCPVPLVARQNATPATSSDQRSAKRAASGSLWSDRRAAMETPDTRFGRNPVDRDGYHPPNRCAPSTVTSQGSQHLQVSSAHRRQRRPAECAQVAAVLAPRLPLALAPGSRLFELATHRRQFVFEILQAVPKITLIVLSEPAATTRIRLSLTPIRRITIGIGIWFTMMPMATTHANLLDRNPAIRPSD